MDAGSGVGQPLATRSRSRPAGAALPLPASPGGQLAARRPQAFPRRLSRMVRMASGRAPAREILVVHRNAPLSETGRLRLARCVVDDGRVAAAPRRGPVPGIARRHRLRIATDRPMQHARVKSFRRGPITPRPAMPRNCAASPPACAGTGPPSRRPRPALGAQALSPATSTASLRGIRIIKWSRDPRDAATSARVAWAACST
jgi:hypothetical protein